MKLIGAFLDLLDPVVWRFFRYYMGKNNFESYWYGKCILFGTPSFIQLGKQGIKLIEQCDAKLATEIQDTQICVIQSLEWGHYSRISNRRYHVPKRLEHIGTEGLAAAITNCYFMYQEYKSMGFFQRHVVRPNPLSSVHRSIKWRKMHLKNKEVVGSLESYLERYHSE